MLQGMARGKVGDVVFSRLNGEQIARVRNRNPKNPRTNAQLYQRAIMATVMQAYSAGKKIFDHAFQGYGIGEACQRRFMSLNAKNLRALIASDLNNSTTPADQQGRVIGPGVSSFCPGRYVISEGTYSTGFFRSAVDMLNNVVFPDQAVTLKAFCELNNLIAGDLYTFVVMSYSAYDKLFEVTDDDTAYSKQFASNFGYVRLQVKKSATEDTTTSGIASEFKVSQLFEVTDYEGIPATAITSFLDTRLSNFDGTQAANVINDLTPTGYTFGAFGVIHSRVDEDLRSNATMVLADGTADILPEFGIVSSFALAAWKQGTEKVGDSDLILEGGDQ